MGNFNKFSTFSKFASFYEDPIWCDVIIIDEIYFLKISFLLKSEIHMLISSSIVFRTIYITFITLLLSNLRLHKFSLRLY